MKTINTIYSINSINTTLLLILRKLRKLLENNDIFVVLCNQNKKINSNQKYCYYCILLMTELSSLSDSKFHITKITKNNSVRSVD